MNKKLFRKFISNKCSKEEIADVFEWVQDKSDEENRQSLFRSYWDRILQEDTIEKELDSGQLDKIHHAINLNQQKNDKNRKFITTTVSGRRLPLIYRAAAILVIPLLLFSLYTVYNNSEIAQFVSIQNYEVVSPPGTRTHFSLPDGTAVWLNHGSKLIYPNRFAGKFRTVKLVGEGYFDVSHNKQMPFIVEAKGMEIKALGTSFNIKAFDGSDFETTLESGKVVVSKEDTGNGDKICEMVPGEHFTFNTSTNKFILRKENLLKYVSWKDGKLVFIDDPIDRVIDRLGHWYNVKITLKDQDLKPLTYTATFVDETLDQVLEMMADISPISYTVINRSKLKDGTFSEKEILIFKKGGLSE